MSSIFFLAGLLLASRRGGAPSGSPNLYTISEQYLAYFLFIMVEFEKVLYSPDVKMVLIFLVTKVFQKGTMFE